MRFKVEKCIDTINTIPNLNSEIRPNPKNPFTSANMKTNQQIQERIKFLEFRQEDGVPVEDTLVMLRWALTTSVGEIHEELVNTVQESTVLPFAYIRDILWVLE